MSGDNAAVVRRLFEAASRRDDETVLRLYDADVEWDASRNSRGEMVGRSAKGRESLVSWFREWYGTWEDIEDRLEELIEAPDGRVVSVSVQRGRGRASGLEVENQLFAVWTVEVGRITHVAWFPFLDGALAAVGLPSGE